MFILRCLRRLQLWMHYGPLGVRWQPRRSVRGGVRSYTLPKRCWIWFGGWVDRLVLALNKAVDHAKGS